LAPTLNMSMVSGLKRRGKERKERKKNMIIKTACENLWWHTKRTKTKKMTEKKRKGAQNPQCLNVHYEAEEEEN